jgi:hypothetical protein
MGNCAGIDWATEKHDVLVEDPSGEELLAATFAHDEDGVSALCAVLVCFDVEVPTREATAAMSRLGTQPRTPAPARCVVTGRVSLR